MKPLIFTVLALLLGGFVAHAANINPRMGGGPMYTFLGSQISVSNTTFALDTNYGAGTAGSKMMLVRLSPPANTTGGTMTCYTRILSITGSPSDTYMLLYASATTTDDDDRPATSTALATSTVVSLTGTTTPMWAAYNFDMTGVTLKTGWTYFVGAINQTATPASNYPTVTSRSSNLSLTNRWQGYTTSDGFISDPTPGTAEAAIVCKFPDGSVIGNPYVLAMPHNNNSNYRGNGYVFDGDVEAAGVCTSTGGIASIGAEPYPTVNLSQESTLLYSAVIDKNFINNGGCFYFDPPITLKGGLRYDVTQDPAGNNTAMGMLYDGDNAPADVSAAKFSGIYYIDGTTLGSFATTSQGNFTAFILQLNNIPSTGLGSGGLWQTQDY